MAKRAQEFMNNMNVEEKTQHHNYTDEPEEREEMKLKEENKHIKDENKNIKDLRKELDEIRRELQLTKNKLKISYKRYDKLVIRYNKVRRYIDHHVSFQIFRYVISHVPGKKLNSWLSTELRENTYYAVMLETPIDIKKSDGCKTFEDLVSKIWEPEVQCLFEDFSFRILHVSTTNRVTESKSYRKSKRKKFD